MTEAPLGRTKAIFHVLDSGRVIDLLQPDFSNLDVAEDIARPLSRIARWSGGTIGERIYSVAQHCVVGADAIVEETGDVNAALAFLCHDGHEAIMGDLTTPSARAIDHHVTVGLSMALGSIAAGAITEEVGTTLFLAALEGFKASLDGALHRLAGLPRKLPSATAMLVAETDARCADLEIRLLRRPLRRPDGRRATADDLRSVWGRAVDARPIRRRGGLSPWPPAKAAEEWMARWHRWRITGAPIAASGRPTLPHPVAGAASEDRS